MAALSAVLFRGSGPVVFAGGGAVAVDMTPTFNGVQFAICNLQLGQWLRVVLSRSALQLQIANCKSEIRQALRVVASQHSNDDPLHFAAVSIDDPRLHGLIRRLEPDSVTGLFIKALERRFAGVE